MFKNLLLIITGFILYYIAFQNFRVVMQPINEALHFKLGSYFLAYVLVGLPIFIFTGIINKSRDIFKYLGLRANLLKGFVLSFSFALPMLVGGFFQFGLSNDLESTRLIAGTLFAGFFEELYFRGYLFGQLYQKTRLGFIPAIIVCSLIFALGHLYQSAEPDIISGVFLTTFMGSVLFAWLYAEWKFNLWVPILLHTFMNLSWALFAMGENALGSPYANLYRGLTIAFAIIATIVYKIKTKQTFIINRNNLFIKKRLPSGLLNAKSNL